MRRAVVVTIIKRTGNSYSVTSGGSPEALSVSKADSNEATEESMDTSRMFSSRTISVALETAAFLVIFFERKPLISRVSRRIFCLFIESGRLIDRCFAETFFAGRPSHLYTLSFGPLTASLTFNRSILGFCNLLRLSRGCLEAGVPGISESRCGDKQVDWFTRVG